MDPHDDDDDGGMIEGDDEIALAAAAAGECRDTITHLFHVVTLSRHDMTNCSLLLLHALSCRCSSRGNGLGS